MEVICLEEKAFYMLIEKVIERLDAKRKDQSARWISRNEAMQKLGIRSRGTLQKLRDEGKIRYSQPEKRIILYDTYSIDDYLEANAHNTF